MGGVDKTSDYISSSKIIIAGGSRHIPSVAIGLVYLLVAIDSVSTVQ